MSDKNNNNSQSKPAQEKPATPQFPRGRVELNDIPAKPSFPIGRIEKGEKPGDIKKG